MWAAVAGPLRLANVSSQLRTAPASDFVTVALNVPRAPLTSPFGAGRSSAAFIAAATWILVAWARAPAAPATIRARAAGMASKASLFTRNPLCFRIKPLTPTYVGARAPDCDLQLLRAVALPPLRPAAFF